MRRQREPVGIVLTLLVNDPDPERLEAPEAPLAADADALDGEFVVGEAERLALAGAAIAEVEGEVDEADIEPEEAADRPRTQRHEQGADGDADPGQHQHQDAETARRCLDAGAKFLTTDGLILEVVEFANMEDIVVFPGALTPTEVIAAWQAGSDFVKVVPCAAVGGENYIKALKTPLAQIPLIAAGGVNQQTAAGYILAGATALGIGEALIPWEAVALRQKNRIRELARRFLNSVETARRETGSKADEVVVNRIRVLSLKEA